MGPGGGGGRNFVTGETTRFNILIASLRRCLGGCLPYVEASPPVHGKMHTPMNRQRFQESFSFLSAFSDAANLFLSYTGSHSQN